MSRAFISQTVFGALFAVLMCGRAGAQDTHDAKEPITAYTALRLVGKTLGADAINHVVEVTGRDGAPQPSTWKIVLQDGAGSKEIEVVDGKLGAQRPISRPASGTPVKLQELNLDSSGAFDLTDTQARKVKVRFDAVNYTLRTSDKTGKPSWTLELFDQTGAPAGTMRIAASNGTVISSSGRIAAEAPATTTKIVADGKPTPKPAPATPRPAVVEAERPRPTPSHEPQIPPPAATTTTTVVTIQPNPSPVVDVPDAGEPEGVPRTADEGGGGFFTRAGRTLDHTQHTVTHSLDRASEDVNHNLRRAGATVQRFFTGRSDLDNDNRPAPPPDNQPD